MEQYKCNTYFICFTIVLFPDSPAPENRKNPVSPAWTSYSGKYLLFVYVFMFESWEPTSVFGCMYIFLTKNDPKAPETAAATAERKHCRDISKTNTNVFTEPHSSRMHAF